MKQINITLTAQQIAQIEQRMKETGLSRSEILRRAIDEYLQRMRGYDAPPTLQTLRCVTPYAARNRLQPTPRTEHHDETKKTN